MKKQISLSLAIALLLTGISTAWAMPGMSNQPAQTSASETPTLHSGEPLTGKVLQTMNSGGYTYVELKQKNGTSLWLATSETPVKVGSQMSFSPGVVMNDFKSKSLNRSFDSIVFSGGVIAVHPASPAPVSTPKTAASSPGSKGALAHKTVTTPVKKASGANAYTIEEAFAKKALLDKKKITIRGKVTKVSNGIMGKNWFHIQDGSGSETKATHDLVCTSLDKAAPGDIVTVTGTLAKDRDFGAGYTYAVIIEDVLIRK
ncbi:MAG: DNA-binding protein [Desulfuromonadales bacterium]|nr:DNA-binding protein [Desulfuromonadales bacterium]